MRFRQSAGRLSVVAIVSLGIAACTARTPAPAPTPAPPSSRPTPAPSPSPAATFSSWMDAPQTPGDWFYRKSATGSVALFGTSGSDARFAITCQLAQRRVTLARAGTAAGAGQMIIRTESATRTLAATPDNGELPSIIAAVGATDPLLDAIAFSKGRFAVEAPDQSPLYLPSWPEITRVIEDCR